MNEVKVTVVVSEVKVTLVQITCLCGAGIHLASADGETFAGKCPLCSKEYCGKVGTFAAVETVPPITKKRSANA